MMLIAWLTGCVNLDSLVFNPVHCSTVGPSTCEELEEPFDQVCTPCAEPYDWQRTYDWPDGTLEPGQTVRPIPDYRITAVPIPTADGEATLDAYFIASHGEDPLLSGVTLIYSHGRYAGIEHYLPRLRFLHEAGYNLFVWDFRGFGKSDPDAVATAQQTLDDAVLVLETARGVAPDPARLVPYAYSLGTFPGTAMLDDVCAVMFEAPFPSLAASAEFGTTLSIPEQFLSSGRIDNAARLEAFAGPVFGMIGTEDEVVPGPDEARAFIESGTGPAELWVVEGASHGVAGGGIPEDVGITTYFAQMRDFVERRCP